VLRVRHAKISCAASSFAVPSSWCACFYVEQEGTVI
jgi:hypothetical protein